MELSLNPAFNLDRFKAELSQSRRGRMNSFLDEAGANKLYKALVEQKDWNLLTYSQGRHVDLDYNGMLQRPPADWKRLEEIAYAEAKNGFGYYFCNVPLYDLAKSGKRSDLPLLEAYRIMNSPEVLAIAREATGATDIAYADAQATKYLSGHFLTTHDDDVGGKNRRAAYVLSMTKNWRADWGGQLQFFGEDGQVERAFVPGFNTLSVFLVPQRHAVSALAPFAGAPRFSITGWFRAGKDPDRR